ncbi:glyoxalase [Asanoa sp. NPDC049518]|uniref:VOC family protein n=1 Tax=unclassified Asanoa TaxID=2685164 RepID=UPI003425D61A
MTTIEYVTLEVADPATADRFYTETLGLGKQVRTRASDAPTTGFRGYTLSLIVSQPANADALIDAAVEAGATVLKPAAKSLWGYGGVVQAPDGTIVTVASSSKKDTAPASKQIDDVVLQLGCTDVSASKQFYVERGLKVAKSFGSKYVEFDSGQVKVTLNKRRSLAKTAGVAEEGSGSHRIAFACEAAPFTDPDGFGWESTTSVA